MTKINAIVGTAATGREQIFGTRPVELNNSVWVYHIIGQIERAAEALNVAPPVKMHVIEITTVLNPGQALHTK